MSSSSLSTVLASVITEAVLELSLYGVFAVIFSAVVYLFWTRALKSKGRPIFFVFLALFILFLSITAHLINAIYMLYLGFAHFGGGIPAAELYLSLSAPTTLAHISLVEVATFITDSLVIHRLYVVWSCNRRVVIFPLIVVLCQLVSGIHIIYDFSRETLFDFYSLSNPWVTSSLVSSLLISGYSSGMIMYKILMMARSFRRISGSANGKYHLRKVLVIIIESSLLQTAMTVGILVSFQIGLLVQSVLTALSPVVFGISVVLIHARVGLGWAKDNYIEPTPTPIALSVSLATSRSEERDLERGK
ncbi:hypothetical protein B0H17DRAFT_1199064 [Mycena rosella]|uniref:Uncharacterized protein n=1 Tax=Mycena rosella TaxID=1033263 RepID=A0AAD7GLC8_MYCRO|nr:hypothetical protein B0H17DRAFT_1199064 [Mycena rosella]